MHKQNFHSGDNKCRFASFHTAGLVSRGLETRVLGLDPTHHSPWHCFPSGVTLDRAHRSVGSHISLVFGVPFSTMSCYLCHPCHGPFIPAQKETLRAAPNWPCQAEDTLSITAERGPLISLERGSLRASDKWPSCLLRVIVKGQGPTAPGIC